jgi:hypothetical protein
MLTRAIISERSAITGRVHAWERYGYYPTTCDALAAHARPGRRVSVCAVKNLPAHIDPNLSQRATVHALEAPQEWEVIKHVCGWVAAIAGFVLLVLSIPQVEMVGEALARVVLK